MEKKNKIQKKPKDLFTIHLATYEGNIIGLHGTLKQLEIKYSFNASPGSIKSLEIGNKYLFVASYDESIRIYDARKFREIGLLEGHTSTILSMKNFQNTLCSSSDDGKILIWKHNTWALMKTLKENKTGVNDIYIDDTGKIMLSISKDSRLFVWNLMKVEKAYQRRFSYNLYKVMMIGHEYICLLSDKDVHIILSKDNSEYKIVKHDQKLCDFVIYKQFLLTGDEKGFIFIWDLNLSDQAIEPKNISFQGHKNRIKKMVVTKIDDMDIVITCSSDGEIKIWDFLHMLNEIDIISKNSNLGDKINSIYSVSTNHRITALTIFNNTHFENTKDNQTQQAQQKIENEIKQTEQPQENEQPKMSKRKIKKLKKKQRIMMEQHAKMDNKNNEKQQLKKEKKQKNGDVQQLPEIQQKKKQKKYKSVEVEQQFEVENEIQIPQIENQKPQKITKKIKKVNKQQQ